MIRPIIQSGTVHQRENPRAIYDDAYAGSYASLYLDPWPAKLETNRRILATLLPQSVRRNGRWLDLCCGHAWHFSLYPEMKNRTGIDLSSAQLKIAQVNNPEAVFLCADVLKPTLAPASFDLVTCFWGAYCYLDDVGRIAEFLERVLEWTAPCGAVYLELLVPDVLAGFNASEFANRTGFRVEPRSPGYGRWAYSDAGGRHLMTSPTCAWFVDLLKPHFTDLQVHDDVGFMSHLVAIGRK
jgi:SAM-dependent methyltransferase